ncbi:hypothetical protein [Rhodonellum psychrophilum]|uniref:hypothetical protein n=1 Tax=Rhodonellum psychrophilum TaxID=336828 RepID=UPI0003A2C4C9|nr:hypothetical protein [Rhodonellum psychrophilum]
MSISGLEGRDAVYEYWVGISGDNTCDVPPLKVEVTVHPLPEATFAGVDALCHDGLGSVLIADGNDDYRYTVSGPESHTALTEVELEALALLQGTYSVTITDISSVLNCEVPGFGFIISSPDPIIPTHAVTDTSCELDNGVALITATGGLGAYRIEIAGNNGFTESVPFAAGATSIEFTGLAPGDYSYTVFDANDCPSIEDNFTVAPSDGPEFGISAASVLEICEDDTAIIIAEMIDEGIPLAVPVYQFYFDEALTLPVSSAGGVTYTDNGSGQLSISGLEGRDAVYEYWVGISGDNTCDVPPLKVEVTVHPLPEAVFTGVDALCHDGLGSVLIGDGNDDYRYTVSGPESHTALTEDALEALALLQGTYSVTITDISSTLNCEVPGFGFTISSPDPIIPTHAVTDTSCELDNGVVLITATGGLGAYRIEIAGNNGFNESVPFAAGATSIEFTGLAPGDYSYTVFDANDCPSIEDNFTVAPSDGPEFGISAASVLEICEDDTAIIIAEMIDEGVPLAIPVYQFYFDEALTQPVSSAGGVTYTDNGSGQLSISGLEGRNAVYEYWVGISGDNTCDVPPLKVEVTVNPLPKATLLAEALLCHDDNFILFVNNPNPDYRYRFPNNEFAGVFDEQQLIGMALAGDFMGNLEYIIEIFTEGTGCFVSQTIHFEQPTPIIFIENEIIPASCAEDNGTISLSFSGGTPFPGNQYLLTLSGPDGYSNTMSQGDASGNYIFTSLASGSYSWTVKDENGCELSGLFEIEDVPGTPVELILEDIEVCAQDGAVVLLEPQVSNAQAPVLKYVWTLDGVAITDGFQSSNGFIHNLLSGGVLQVSNLTAGIVTDIIYDLEVTGTLLCTATDQLTLTVYPEITFSLDYASEICLESDRVNIEIRDLAGGKDDNYTVTLAGVDFAGNSINLTQSGTLFENVPAGEYSLTVSGDAGCSTVFEPIIISLPESEISLDFDLSNANCGLDNGSIQIDGITGGFGPEFIWEFYAEGNDPITDTPLFKEVWNNTPYTLTDLAEGNYFFRVFDRNGCFVDFPIEIETAPDPIFTIEGPVEVCEGDTNGNFVISATNTEPDAENLNVLWYLINSDGSRTELSNNATVGSATYTLLGVGTDSPALQINGLQPGIYNYELLVACTNVVLQTSIQIDPLPFAQIKVEPILCDGDDFVLTISEGNDDYRFDVVSGPAGFVALSELTEQELINVAATFVEGIYVVEVYNSNLRTCSIDFSLDFNKPEVLNLTVNIEDASCGLPDGSIRFEIGGGTPLAAGGYNVALLLDGNLLAVTPIISGGGTVYLFEGLLPSENYTWTITDLNGCLVEGGDEVPNDQGIEIEVSVDPLEVCADEEAIILPNIDAAGNAFTATWFKDAARTVQVQNGLDANDGLTYTVNSSTGELAISGFTNSEEVILTYFLRVTGAGICTPPLQELKLTVVPAITLELDYRNEICDPEEEITITVNASGGRGDFSYSIDGGSTWQVENTFTVTGAGEYVISVESAFGCEAEITATINLAEEPIDAVLIAIPTSCGADIGSIEIDQITGGFGDYTWEWQDENGNAIGVDNAGILEGLAMGSYILKVTDRAGCVFEFPIVVGTAPEPDFTAIDDVEICEEDIDPAVGITVNSQNQVPSASNLQVTWYKGPGLQELINEGSDPSQTGVVFTFINNVPQNRGLNIVGLSPGVYAYTMLVNCTQEEISFTITVNEAPDPVFDIIPIVCFGEESGKIIPVNPEADWEFSVDGSALMSASALEAMNFGVGTYTIEVLAANTCQWIGEVIVEGPDKEIGVDPVSTINPSCGENIGRITLKVSGGWPKYRVQLFEDQARTILIEEKTDVAEGRVSFSGLGSGNYYIRIIDAADCVFDWSTNTELEDGPTQILVDAPEVCEGEIIELTPEILQTNADPVYQWFFDGALTDAITDGMFNAGVLYTLDATGNLSIDGLTGTMELFVIVTGQGTCEGFVGNVNLTVLPGINFDLEVVEELCPEDGGMVRFVDVSGGNGNYEYSIDGINWQSSPEFLGVQSGDFEAAVRSGQCIALKKDSLNPAEPMALELERVEDAACGAEDGKIFFSILGGFLDTGDEYSIALLDEALNDANVGTLVDLGNGEYAFEGLPVGNYAIRVMDSNGCVQLLTDLKINTQLEEGETYLENYEFCESDFFALTVEEALFGLVNNSGAVPVSEWRFAGVVINPADMLSAGVYEAFQIYESNGCPVQDVTSITVTSTQASAPTVANEEYVICSGEEIAFSVLEAFLDTDFGPIDWIDGNGDPVDSQTVLISEAGIWTAVQVKAPVAADQCPEFRETNFEIKVEDPIDEKIAVTYTYCEFETISLDALEARLIQEGRLDASQQTKWEDQDGNEIPQGADVNFNNIYFAVQSDESSNCIKRKVVEVDFVITQQTINPLPPRSFEICETDAITLADLRAANTDIDQAWEWFDDKGIPVSQNETLQIGMVYQVIVGTSDGGNACSAVDSIEISILSGDCGDPTLEPLPILVLEDRVICEGDLLVFRPVIQNRRGRPLTIMYFIDSAATLLIETVQGWNVSYNVNGEVRIQGMVTQPTPYTIYGVLMDESNRPIYGPVPMKIIVDPLPEKPTIRVIGGRKTED